jgi:hypothetical protein
VTSEIGYQEQFIDDWVVKTKEQAFKIVHENSKWLEYIFANLPRYSLQLATKKEEKPYKAYS